MSEPLRQSGRRAFLHDLGRRSFAVVLLGGVVAACSDDDGDGDTGAGTTGPTGATDVGPTSTSSEGTEPPASTAAGADGALTFRRVELGFVSAYVVVRGSEAAVVDTGNQGDAPRIEEALGELGFGWDAVGHLVLTHSHGDHVGALAEITTAAPGVTAYAGGADIEAIDSPVDLVAVGDGDQVFGLDVVATPGHTPGHISVLDPAGSVLLAGDALIGADGGVQGPAPQFTSDLDTAHDSVRKLAGFDFETVVFGHGDPVEEAASEAVAALAATL